MKKHFRFKKHIHTVYVPILLNPFTPWQEQVELEIERFNSRWLLARNHNLDFEINRTGARLVVTR